LLLRYTQCHDSNCWVSMVPVPLLKIAVKVIPASGMRKCTLDKAGALKCYVQSPAEDGAANKELIKFFAKSLGVAQDDITIIVGLTSRKKVLAVRAAFTYKYVLECLGLEVQDALF